MQRGEETSKLVVLGAANAQTGCERPHDFFWKVSVKSISHKYMSSLRPHRQIVRFFISNTCCTFLLTLELELAHQLIYKDRISFIAVAL